MDRFGKITRIDKNADYVEGLSVGDELYYLSPDHASIVTTRCELVVNGIGYAIYRSEGFHPALTPIEGDGWLVKSLDELASKEKDWIKNAKETLARLGEI